MPAMAERAKQPGATRPDTSGFGSFQIAEESEERS
jgi:hypothetical protein